MESGGIARIKLHRWVFEYCLYYIWALPAIASIRYCRIGGCRSIRRSRRYLEIKLINQDSAPTCDSLKDLYLSLAITLTFILTYYDPFQFLINKGISANSGEPAFQSIKVYQLFLASTSFSANKGVPANSSASPKVCLMPSKSVL